MELSKRLQAVADMVTDGNITADVGCDHGYVSIYLIKQGISPHVIAMDVNKGPLLRAREHIEGELLSAYIEIRLSDGVSALNIGEADILICAGMGGKLTIRILEQGSAVTSYMKEWILQPQSDIRLVRQYIRSRGCRIIDEKMVYEEGKFYPLMKVSTEPSKQQETDELVYPESKMIPLYDKFGPVLLQKKDSVLHAYLLEQQTKYEEIQTTLEHTNTPCHTNDRRQNRIEEVKQELESIKQALSFYK